MEETIVISRSNKRVNAYNNGIRNRVLYREEELSSGDILMITKNNYFWTQEFEQMERLDFLANGEFVEVTRVRGEEEMYGFRFLSLIHISVVLLYVVGRQLYVEIKKKGK